MRQCKVVVVLAVVVVGNSSEFGHFVYIHNT